MMRYLSLLLLSVPAACSVSRPPSDAAATDTLPGGIVRTIAAEPADWPGTTGWKVTVERIIQPSDESVFMLSEIRQMLLLPDGGLVVSDGTLTRLIHFPADPGVEPRIIARYGSGPGEISQPRIALLGDTIMVHSPPISRLALLDPAGQLLGESTVATSHFGPPIAADRLGRVWVIEGIRGGTVPPPLQWVRYDPAGRRLDSIPVPQATVPATWVSEGATAYATFPIPYAASNRHLVLSDGTILHGSTDADRFFISRTGTDTVRIFGRSGTLPHPVTDDEGDTMFDRYTGNPMLANVARRSDIPSVKPLWLGLHQDGTGDIWVHRRPVHPGDAGTMFDIYTVEGRYRGTVAVPFVSTSLALSSDRIAVADEDLDGFPRITIYRIDRGPRP